MNLISEANFIVIDVETTGANAFANRITDISCVTVNNFEIVDTYSTLVNPHQRIPPYIQRMTGIKDAMVKNAPESKNVFGEVSKLLSEENTIFVAHNANFDWNFVLEAIRRAGIPFASIPIICTLKIGRKILPSKIKKNVGDLAKYFNIPIANRHRAFDDAFATANFFIEMLLILQDRYDITTIEELLDFQDRKTVAQKNIDNKIIEKLSKYQKLAPEVSGIITFISSDGKVLYISKSINISESLIHYMEDTANAPKKIRNVLKKFKRIEWIETDSELETNILENRKIKYFNPEYNTYHLLDLANADDIVVNEYSQKLLVKNLSLIVLLPNSETEKTVDVFFINKGKFFSSMTVGTKANLENLYNEIHNGFYSEKEINNSNFDIDEIRIINIWLTKTQSISKIFRVDDQEELIIDEQIETAIRGFYNEVVEENDFYVGTFIFE
jgi:DNA polymerase III epsilon subunit family exonuclease